MRHSNLEGHLFILRLMNSLTYERCHDRPKTALHVICDCDALAELRFCHLYSHFMDASDYRKISAKQSTALPSRCRTGGGLNLRKEIHSSRSEIVMVQ